MSSVTPADDGWWKATDGNWYPPDHPRQEFDPRSSAEPLSADWWFATDGRWYPPEMRPGAAHPTSATGTRPSQAAAATDERVSASDSPLGWRRLLSQPGVMIALVTAAFAVAVVGGFAFRATLDGEQQGARLDSAAPPAVAQKQVTPTTVATAAPPPQTEPPPPPTTEPPPPPPTTTLPQPPATTQPPPSAAPPQFTASEIAYLESATSEASLSITDPAGQQGLIDSGREACRVMAGAYAVALDLNFPEQKARESGAIIIRDAIAGSAFPREQAIFVRAAGTYLCPEFGTAVRAILG